MAAPFATARSQSVWTGSHPRSLRSASAIIGMRDEPPTSSTLSTPRPETFCWAVSTVRLAIPIAHRRRCRRGLLPAAPDAVARRVLRRRLGRGPRGGAAGLGARLAPALLDAPPPGERRLRVPRRAPHVQAEFRVELARGRGL